jgi:hypothetical protein
LQLQAASCEKVPMASGDPAETAGEMRPILPWRLVAGAFLHFIIPAYLVAALVDWQLGTPANGESFLRHLPAFSAIFLAIYAAAALVCSLGAAGLDRILRERRARREAADPMAPARWSERRVAAAVQLGKGRFGGAGDAALERLLQGHWLHGDARYQALSSDLDAVVQRSVAALAHATDEGRAAVVETACAAIGHVGEGLAALEAAERGRAESEARTVARYVELRYGASDFAGDGD